MIDGEVEKETRIPMEKRERERREGERVSTQLGQLNGVSLLSIRLVSCWVEERAALVQGMRRRRRSERKGGAAVYH